MSDSTYAFFLGVDLGSGSHCAPWLDQEGQSLGGRTFEHGGAARREFLEWLFQKTGDAARQTVAAAVAAPRGAVIDALLESGLAVFSINPKQRDRFRPCSRCVRLPTNLGHDTLDNPQKRTPPQPAAA